MKQLNVPYSSIYSAFISNMTVPDELYNKVIELQKRLASLHKMELDGKTKYSGNDLNLLDTLTERLCSEELTQKDILEIEKLMFKFM